MSAIYSLLLLEIKSHKQRWHIKDAVKQKGLAKKPRLPVRTQRVRWSFLKIFTLEGLLVKLCF